MFDVPICSIEDQRKENMIRVAICGLDGIGKTTLIEKLKERFIRNNIAVAQTRVPFTCKTLMKDIGCEELSEFEIIKRIGMMFDFVEHYYRLDVTVDVLICDRYDIDFEVLNDTYNIPENYKNIMHNIYMRAPRLDVCFFLRADYLVAAERLNKRGNRKNDENDEILIKMQSSFEKRIKDYPNSVILDATKTEEEIANDAYMTIFNLLQKK